MSGLVLIIGQKNYSSWSLRPWLLLKELGLPFEERRVLVAGSGFNPGTHGSYSPSGVVPVLHGPNGLCAWDSLSICEWAAEQAAVPSPSGARAWPADARARAVARSLAAEMHSGFGAVRSAMPCNVKARLRTPLKLDAATAAQVSRLERAWGDARREFGAPSSGGPYLFGQFGVVDAFFAPVAFRFQTYGVELADADARAYVAALLANPHMQAWAAEAIAETDAIEHYDAAALAVGAEFLSPKK